jgi:hypothetical protein
MNDGCGSSTRLIAQKAAQRHADDHRQSQSGEHHRDRPPSLPLGRQAARHGGADREESAVRNGRDNPSEQQLI